MPDGLSIVDRRCPHCGYENPRKGDVTYGDGIWRVVDCQGCGFVYLDKSPDYDELFSRMAWEKTTKAEEVRRETARPVSYKLSKKTRKRLHLFPRKDVTDLVARYVQPGNVVDLGCGNGILINKLRQDFTPFGIEISSALAEQAETLLSARAGSAINAPSLHGLQTFDDGFFSGATLRSYLEHEMNPKSVLNELHRVLKPGGVAIIKVPNYGSVNRRVMGGKWCGFRFPDHLNYFTPASLAAMVLDCGYRVHRFGILDRMPTSDNMWMIAEK
jgi:SAM-dependent methyltransferase